MSHRPNDLTSQFGPLTPTSQPPSLSTLLKNINTLRAEFERLRDLHDRQLESEMRTVQLAIRSLLRDLQQRFPSDYDRLFIELAALLNYRTAPPPQDTGKPTVSLQENLNAIGYEE